MNTPIKYFGGKGTMFNNIIEHFPKKEDFNIYVEPFGGSFSIGLKKPETEIEIYNDIEQNVYSLYKVLSDKELFDDFKFKCDLVHFSEDLRKEYKEKLKGELSILDRAFYFFYVNRTSHNGVGGITISNIVRRKMSKTTSDFLSAIDRLPELHDRLSKVLMLNTDGIKLIEKYKEYPNCLIYADPPYEQSTRTNARYIEDMDREGHIKFIDSVLNSNAKILISGYDCELYNRLTDNGFTKVHFEVKTVDGNHKPKTKIETLWKNYE
jgi:DNA adenine methylase